MRFRCKRSSAAVANLGGCGTFGTVAGGTVVGEPDIFSSVALESHSLLKFQQIRRFLLIQDSPLFTQPKRRFLAHTV
jgi:hypothetical protein